MKKMMVLGAVLCVAVAQTYAQDLSLADARAGIGGVISSPASLTATIKRLSAENQVAYLADVNEAIQKMPASGDARAAAFLNANRAALKGGKKGNTLPLLSEVFATVSPEALTVINETFAAELFNRAADASKTYTDEQFAALAENSLAVIHKRTAKSDNTAVRDVFAILMFVRASNGTPTNLVTRLTEKLDEKARNLARTTWIPAALGSAERPKDYGPLLGAADAGNEPNVAVVMRFATPDVFQAMLSDLHSVVDANGYIEAPLTSSTTMGAVPGSLTTSVNDERGLPVGLNRVPIYYNRSVFGTEAAQHGYGRKIGSGKNTASVATDLHYGSGQTVPAGSTNIGKNDFTIITPTGSTEVVKPGETSTTGGTVVSPTGADVRVPPGTPIAPGGTPVSPTGEPVGPGGRVINPDTDGGEVTPSDDPGYQYQD